MIALSDAAPEVRAQAVILAGRRLDRSREILERVLRLAGDDDPRVRFRVALALGETSDRRAVTALVQIARRDVANRWMRAAVLSSCAATADRVLAELVGAQKSDSRRPESVRSAGTQPLLEEIVSIVGARNRPDEVKRVLDALAASGAVVADDSRDRLVLALAQAARRGGGRLPTAQDAASSGAALVAGLLREARTRALDPHTSEATAVSAIEVLGLIDPVGSRPCCSNGSRRSNRLPCKSRR